MVAVEAGKGTGTKEHGARKEKEHRALVAKVPWPWRVIIVGERADAPVDSRVQKTHPCRRPTDLGRAYNRVKFTVINRPFQRKEGLVSHTSARCVDVDSEPGYLNRGAEAQI